MSSESTELNSNITMTESNSMSIFSTRDHGASSLEMKKMSHLNQRSSTKKKTQNASHTPHTTSQENHSPGELKMRASSRISENGLENSSQRTTFLTLKLLNLKLIPPSRRRLILISLPELLPSRITILTQMMSPSLTQMETHGLLTFSRRSSLILLKDQTSDLDQSSQMLSTV